MRTAVYFVPIVTTVTALGFAGVVIARWLDRRQIGRASCRERV